MKDETPRVQRGVLTERVTRIELVIGRWERPALPLRYTRVSPILP